MTALGRTCCAGTGCRRVCWDSSCLAAGGLAVPSLRRGMHIKEATTGLDVEAARAIAGEWAGGKVIRHNPYRAPQKKGSQQLWRNQHAPGSIAAKTARLLYCNAEARQSSMGAHPGRIGSSGALGPSGRLDGLPC